VPYLQVRSVCVRFSTLSAEDVGIGLLVRGYISCVDTCPFEGWVDPVRVKEIAVKLKEMGCYEISLGDTVGTAVPATVTALIDEVVKGVDVAHLAVSAFSCTKCRYLSSFISVRRAT
jgi:hydroxymethylglutaryl-CoA lyase